VEEKTDEPEQTPEREKVPDKDRSENISRRGRRFDNRFDSRPPRLAARGRGRDRPNRENNDTDAGENGFGTFGQDRGFDGRGRGRGRGGRGIKNKLVLIETIGVNLNLTNLSSIYAAYLHVYTTIFT